MPMSEAKKRANKKWNDENLKIKYDRIQVVIPKGRKAAVEAHASSKGESVNGLVNALLRADMGFTEAEWKQTEEKQGE